MDAAIEALNTAKDASGIAPVNTATGSLWPQRPKGRGSTILELNAALEALNLAKEASGITLAKAIFDSVSVILATIRVGSLPVFVD